MNITDRFINNIEELEQKPISDRVLERVRQSLLDYLAVRCAGTKANEDKLNKYLTLVQPEEGQSTLIGMKKSWIRRSGFLGWFKCSCFRF